MRNGHRHIIGALALALGLAASAAPAGAAAPVEDLGEGWPGTHQPASADGRYVVFESGASNLVEGDTNGQVDIFVRDRVAGTVERVNVSSSGAQANKSSRDAAISADGRYVAFVSEASSLVPNDTNGNSFGGCCWGDVFVHDREAGTTERVSVTTDGTEGPGLFPTAPTISADGRYVAFNSHDRLSADDPNNTGDAYLRDRVAGTTTRLAGAAAGSSWDPMISANGRYVAFTTSSALQPEDTNGWEDVYVHDRITGEATLASVSSDEQLGDWHALEPPAISADGRYVAFMSWATNLVPGDANERQDVFVRDLVDGTTERVSVGGAGREADDESTSPMISADGRFVAFESDASNLVPGRRSDSYLRDRELGRTRILRDVTDSEYVLAPDGRTILFSRYQDGDGAYHVFVTELAPSADATPPTLTLPQDMQAQATSWDGAAVSYDVGVEDDTDPDPGLQCRPGSDAVFPLGETAVRCLAADEAGNEREGSFLVDVRDTTPPRMRAPERIALDATGPAGAPVAVADAVEAQDAVEGGGSVTCSPASGSTFAAGTTPVQCSAADAAGNVGHASFEVLVREPATVPALSVSDVRVSEAHKRTAVQVTLSEPAAQQYDLEWSLADGTATAPDDYEAQGGSLTIAPGATHATIKIWFADDRAIEGDEDFSLQVFGGPAGPRDDSGTVTIADDDAEIVNKRGNINGPVVFARGGIDFEERPGAISEVPPAGGAIRALVSERRGLLSQPAVSPDGRRVLYVAPPAEGDGWQRILKMYDRVTGRARVVGRLYGAFHSPIWQPDGEAYGWIQEPADCGSCKASLAVRPYGGRDEYSVDLLGQRVSHAAWSPDGRHVAYDFYVGDGLHELAVVDVVTGENTLLTDLDDGLGASWPTWSPDGTRLAFEEYAEDSEHDIAVMPAAGGEAAPLPEGGDDRMPAWSPDGARIAFSRGAEGSRSIVTATPEGFDEVELVDGSHDAVEPDWVPITDTTKPTVTIGTPAERTELEVGETALASYACADEGGSELASCEGDVPPGGAIDTETAGRKQFTVTATDGAGNVTTVTHHYRVLRIAGRISFERGGDVWLVDGDGAGERQVTDTPAVERDPAISPDGRRIAFVRGGSIVLSALDGSGEQVLTPAGAEAPRQPRLSPDGERVVFAAGPEGAEDVWVMDADGTDAHAVTGAGRRDLDPAWAGDGLLFASAAPGEGFEVTEANADGSGRATIATGVADTRDPVVSRDGGTIAFRGRAGDGDPWSVHVMDSSGDGERVVRGAYGGGGRIALSPDGRRVAFTRDDAQVTTIKLDGTRELDVAAGGPLGDWAPIPPDARASHRLAGSLEIGFDGRASTDADGEIAEYRWRFGDGTAATGAQVTHAYAEERTYTATLTVVDETGAEDTTELAVDPIKGILTIGEPAPTPSLIAIDKRLRCGANGPDGRPLFAAGGTACGTFVALGGTLYGPPGALGVAEYEAFEPVEQVARTGAGTEDDPYVLQTTVALGGTGVQLVQTDSYVKGLAWYRSDAELVNASREPVSARLYRAGDCELAGADDGRSLADAGTASAGCGAATGDAASALMPLTDGASYQAGAADDVFASLTAGDELPGTCACTRTADHAAAIGWTVPLAAGARATRSALHAFPADGRLPALLSLAPEHDTVEPLDANAFTATLRNPNAEAITVDALSARVDGATYRPGTTSGMTTAEPLDPEAEILTWTELGTLAGHASGTLRFGVEHAPEEGTARARAAADLDGAWPVVGRTLSSIRPVATAQVTVRRLDGTPPNTSITTPPPAIGNDAAPPVSFVANEEGATFECRVAADWVPCASGDRLSPLLDGAYEIEVRAVGAAGPDPTPATASFRIDTVAPQTALRSAPAALTRVNAPVFELAGSEEDARLECRMLGGGRSPAFADCGPRFVSAPLADGWWTFEGRAVDAAGNVDPTPVRHAFVVDTTPPETVIDAIDGKRVGDVDTGTGGSPAGGATGGGDGVVAGRLAITGDGVAPLRLACPANATAPCRGTVGLATDQAMLAQAEFEIPPGGAADLALALPSAVRNRIERSGRLPVVVTIGDDSGRAVRGDELVLTPDPRTPRVRDAGLDVAAGSSADLRLTCPRSKSGGCLGSVELLRVPAGYARVPGAVAAARNSLARGRFSVRRGKTARSQIALSPAARRLVRRSGRVRVLVRVTTRQKRGRAVRKTVDLTLKAKGGRR